MALETSDDRSVGWELGEGFDPSRLALEAGRHPVPEQVSRHGGLPQGKRQIGQPAVVGTWRDDERGCLVTQVGLGHQGPVDPQAIKGGSVLKQRALIGDAEHHEVVRVLQPLPHHVGMGVAELERAMHGLRDLEPGGEIGADEHVEVLVLGRGEGLVARLARFALATGVGHVGRCSTDRSAWSTTLRHDFGAGPATSGRQWAAAVIPDMVGTGREVWWMDGSCSGWTG